MAMVISQTTKAAIGGFLALMILGAVLVVGAAFGWFDPKREDEDTPAKVSARLQGRTSFVTHRAGSDWGRSIDSEPFCRRVKSRPTALGFSIDTLQSQGYI
ncbi:unnamed protein product [Arctia plantaginis]|uniref:Uncharacterized protein n=1 Tax=Arctia plantaginis TaxID=874455 RepID=A0A8S1BC28_ARCPL|nr:unnamed protein product [Arctia plantaginis]